MRNVGSSTKDGLALFLLLGCWGWLHCAEAAHGEALSPQRPNVLMIIVDDLNDWVEDEEKDEEEEERRRRKSMRMKMREGDMRGGKGG